MLTTELWVLGKPMAFADTLKGRLTLNSCDIGAHLLKQNNKFTSIPQHQNSGRVYSVGNKNIHNNIQQREWINT